MHTRARPHVKPTWAAQWRAHTFKREFAMVAFVVWLFLTIKVFFFSNPVLIGALGTPYATASTSIWLYIFGAFSMDFAAKQFGDNFRSYGQPQYGSQYGGGAFNQTTIMSSSSGLRPRLSPNGSAAVGSPRLD